MDQTKYDPLLNGVFNHTLLRDQVVSNTKITAATKALALPVDKKGRIKVAVGNKMITLDQWMLLMSADGYYCDQLFLQLACELLNRTFVLVTVHKEEGFNGTGIIQIDPKKAEGDPMYFLYYTETRYVPYFCK